MSEMDNRFNEIIEPLSPKLLNPVWYSFLESVEARSYRLRSAPHVVARELEYELDTIGWLGDEARVTGKIRVEIYDEDVELPHAVKVLLEQCPQGSDAFGDFYEVSGELLELEGVVASGSEGVDGDIITKEEYLELLFCTPDDEDMDGFCITARPEDIVDIEFSRQPIANIENRLQYHCPDAYAHMDELVHDMMPLGEAVEALGELDMSLVAGMDEQQRRHMEMLLTDRLYIEGSMYNVHADGVIYTVNDGGELLQVRSDEPICQTQFSEVLLWENDEGGLEPRVVFEVPCADEPGIKALYMVALGDIVRVDDLHRNINRHFGKQALMAVYGMPGDGVVAEMMRKGAERAKQRELLRPLDNLYDEEAGAMRVPIPVLDVIRREFQENSQCSMQEMVDRHMLDLSDLVKSIRAVDSMFVDENGDLFCLDGGEYVQGEFHGLSVLTFEDDIRKVAIQLRNVVCVDDEGNVNDMFSKSIINVALEADSVISEVWYDEGGSLPFQN